MNVRIIGAIILVLALALGIYFGVTLSMHGNSPVYYSLHGNSADGYSSLTLINGPNGISFEIVYTDEEKSLIYRYINDGNLYAIAVPLNRTNMPWDSQIWNCLSLPISKDESVSLAETVKLYEGGFSFTFADTTLNVVTVNGEPTNFAGYDVDVFMLGTSNLQFRNDLPSLIPTTNSSQCTSIVNSGSSSNFTESSKYDMQLNPNCAASKAVELMKRVYGCTSFTVGNIRCQCETLNGDQMATCTASSGSLDGGASMYLVFSGSQNIQNWISNLKLSSVYNHDIQMNVHSGINEKFYQWKTRIDQLLSTNGGKIIFMGHSLGGAISRIAATYARTKYPARSYEVQSTGEPASLKSPYSTAARAVGGWRLQNFNRYPGSCNILVPNLRDPVPVLTEPFGYSHPQDKRVSSFVSESSFSCTWKWYGPTNCRCRGSTSWSKSAPSVIPIVGDMGGVLIHMMDKYTSYTDALWC